MNKLNNNGFTFKRFFIAHDKSPMKVTTDSCLLGAWSPLTGETDKVLDIGCGCGIIALMLAQRLENSSSVIDAIDIDEQAVLQCQENSRLSPFDSVAAHCIDINQYRFNNNHYYDLIVTNPPYFSPAVECRNTQRQQARYTENLNHPQLITIAKRLLKPNGSFCVVLPYHLSAMFTSLCEKQGLHLARQMQVKYTENKDFSLTLLCFSPQIIDSVVSEILIMRSSDGRYSAEFRNLLQDFYLFRDKNHSES